MLIINEAVNSRCGHPIAANCSCGGHKVEPDLGEYTGRYSDNYVPRDDERIENVKVEPMPDYIWNFDDPTATKASNAVVENAAAPELYDSHGLYYGAGAGQSVRNVQRADDSYKPTAMPDLRWDFPNPLSK